MKSRSKFRSRSRDVANKLRDRDLTMSDSGDVNVVGRAIRRWLLVFFGIFALIGGIFLLNLSGLKNPELNSTETKSVVEKNASEGDQDGSPID